MSPDQNTHVPGATPSTPPAPARPADGFLSSLADLESRIGAFKAMHEQAAARDLELSQRERSLAERDASISAKAATVERSRADMAREAAEFAKWEESARTAAMEAQSRASALEKDVTARLATLERSEADLSERERAMAAKAVRAEAAIERAAKQEEEVEAARRELDAARVEIGNREAEVAERASSLVHERETVERQKAEAEAAIVARDDSMRTREQELREGEIDLTSQRAEMERERAGLTEQARSLAAQMKSRDEEQNSAIWTSRLETMEMEIGQARGARAHLETELAQSRAEIESLTNELINANQNRGVPTDELAKRDRALEEARVALNESRAALRMMQDRVDALDQAAAEKGEMVSRAEHERMEKELAAARELLEQAEASTRDTVSAAEVRRREADIAGLEQALKEAERTAGDLARSEIESREATIADLRAQLAQTTADPTHESEEIAKRDEAISILRERLDEALAAAAQPSEQHEPLGYGRPASATSPTSVSPERRERLRRYKSMLQTQARKIVAAQTALQRRHADCELVLTNRSRLAELAQQLSRAEKRMVSGKARSGAAAAMLYMVATLVLLAGLSWEVSKRIWPGVYIARAVVEADTGRRTPKPEDLAAWQQDHAAMLTDPRLMEMAADRMQRRGLPALGTPADLAARLKDDMYVQPGKAGSLTVELRGEGAEKSALVLDTLITSFKSFADQAREERSNDIGIIIAQAATPSAEPLMDKRLERAGGVFGGAALAAGLAGLVIWSRLVRAKKKFDQAAAVDAALQEVDWTALEASIRKHAGKDGASASA